MFYFSYSYKSTDLSLKYISGLYTNLKGLPLVAKEYYKDKSGCKAAQHPLYTPLAKYTQGTVNNKMGNIQLALTFLYHLDLDLASSSKA
mmetsp:Transcript_3633/g.336  ORF Transcript_3633/g.336 Transcript_3633/m.336 type:complete len:89 (+) Transcript_3633:145-411(+)